MNVLDHHTVREQLQKAFIQPAHISSSNQLAHVFNKALLF